MKKIKYVSTYFLILILGTCPQFLQAAASEKTRMQILSLVDYIAGDYSGAVGSDGAILSTTEYEELKSFSEAAIRYFEGESTSLDAALQKRIGSGLAQLQKKIHSRAPLVDVVDECKDLRREIIVAFQIRTFPSSKLSHNEGARLYQENCAGCHAIDGRGNGPISQGMEPPPRDFHLSEVYEQLSPFKVFNTQVSGIAGTAMQSFFGQLRTEEMWDLAFYLTSLPKENYRASLGESAEAWWRATPQDQQKALLEAGLNLEVLASLSDLELRDWLKQHLGFLQSGDGTLLEQWVAAMRLYAPFVVPQSAGKAVVTNPEELGEFALKISRALAKVEEAKEAFAKGKYSQAEMGLLSGYLDEFEGCERLLGLKNATLVLKIEQEFVDARAYALGESAEKFYPKAEQLKQDLIIAKEAIQKAEVDGGSSYSADFAASLVIILREGFEAFLIVSALLALLTNLGMHAAKRWVHAAWVMALVCGFISYGLFEWVLQLSGAAKESIEAVTTGIAVLLLFYTGFWLLSQSEHKRWQNFIRISSSKALGAKRLSTVLFIAFIAVYREAVETVLFYEALLSGASSALSVGLGFVVGCCLLLVACLLIVWFNMRLPLQKFFKATSILMITISIVLSGKLIHELVEAGYFNPTPIPGVPVIEVLGIYPSVETIAAQIFLIFTTIGLTLYKKVKATSIQASFL